MKVLVHFLPKLIPQFVSLSHSDRPTAYAALEYSWFKVR